MRFEGGYLFNLKGTLYLFGNPTIYSYICHKPLYSDNQDTMLLIKAEDTITCIQGVGLGSGSRN